MEEPAFGKMCAFRQKWRTTQPADLIHDPAQFGGRNVMSAASRGRRRLEYYASGVFPRWRLVTRLLGPGLIARFR